MWNKTKEKLPPEDIPVLTKIDNENGIRNEATLVYSQRMWWMKDKSMYVYYTPTHWKLDEQQ